MKLEDGKETNDGGSLFGQGNFKGPNISSTQVTRTRSLSTPNCKEDWDMEPGFVLRRKKKRVLINMHYFLPHNITLVHFWGEYAII